MFAKPSFSMTIVAILLAAANAPAAERGAILPWTVHQPGFVVEPFATGFQLPVNIAFVPDPGDQPGDPFFYVTELYGIVKVVTRNGTVSDYATDLLNFNPTGEFPGSGEQGLSGIVVDPISGDVFVTLLYDAGGPHYPKVDRFSSVDGGFTAATQTTILDMFGESQGQSHQISNVTIGPDGKLYVHVGDGFDASTAQNLDSFRGKILRMNLDGTAPTDNPFYDAGNGINARDYVFAYGVRNPFGGAWRSADGFHYEVENGPARDRFARIVEGRNYLWDGTDSSMNNFALYVWVPATAPVNLAFVQPDLFGGSGFPAEKMDHAFVSESGPTWATGPQTRGKRISEFVIDTNGVLVSGPTDLISYDGTGKATVVALAAGPDGLYFSDFYKDENFVSPIDRGSNIHRVRFVGAVNFAADVTNGPAPLTVQFTDTSSVPGPTAWAWDFGDGGTSDQQNPMHTFNSNGAYSVELSVTGTNGISTLVKPGFIIVGQVSKIAMIGGALPPSLSDDDVANHLRGLGYLVDAFDDEPANRPGAPQLAIDYDLVIASSTIISSNIASEFRDVAIPLIYWEQALNAIDREPLSSAGLTIGDSAIDILTNGHPVTTNMPTGFATVFGSIATMSCGSGTVGPGAKVLAVRSGTPGDYAIMVADSGATLLGGHNAPARRVFLYLEDSSWFAATDRTRQVLEQAVKWSLGQQIPGIPGDADDDGDVDLSDYAVLADCLNGPDGSPTPTPPTTAQDCLDTFDADADLDVDLGDAGQFQLEF